MRRRIVHLLVLAVLLSLGIVGCKQPEAPTAATQKSPFDDLRNGWIADLEARRLQQSLDRYAPDAVFINPDGTHSIGSAAIRSLYKSVFATFTAKITMTPISNELSGKLAYESGTYTEQTEELQTHKIRNVRGDYLTVYRLQSPGKWLIVQQVWTEAPPSK